MGWGQLPTKMTVNLNPEDTGEWPCGKEGRPRLRGLWREVWSTCTNSLFPECMWF